MKTLIILTVLLLCVQVPAQFRDDGMPKEEIMDGIVSKRNSTSLFGLFNSEIFQMRHSYNLSYSSIGGQGLALGVYTNSMLFRLASNLDVQVDASFVHSPYSTFSKEFQNSINGIYLSNASVNYRPWSDVFISVQYSNEPYNYYYPFYYGRYGYNLFNRFDYYYPEYSDK
ncbi:MAG: hypothetical protein Kow0098_10330 [Ignavibacteriaceae bacterium]